MSSVACVTPPAARGGGGTYFSVGNGAAGFAERGGFQLQSLMHGFDSWMSDPEVKPSCDGLSADVIWIIEAAGKSLAELPTVCRISPRSSPKELLWCCFVFLASRLQPRLPLGERKGGRRQLRLERLLAHCGFTLVEFFKEVRQMVGVLLPVLAKELGEEPEAVTTKLEVRELQLSFVYTTTLMKRYQDMFASKFEIATPNHPNNDPNFRFGWLLYLVAKAKLLSGHPDLVTCFNLLVAVFNVLMVHMPARKRRVQLTDSLAMPVVADDCRVDTVASLATTTGAMPADVQALSKAFTPVLVGVMSHCGHEPSEHPEAAVIVPGCPYFAGLLDSAAARTAAMTNLETAYAAANAAAGALYSETAFLDMAGNSVTASPLRMTPRISHWRPSQSSAYANSSFAMPSPLRTGLTHPGPSSPFHASRPGLEPPASGGSGVSGALSSTVWLKNLAAVTPAEPTEALLRHFRSCEHDRTPEITARVAELAAVAFPTPTEPGATDSLAERRGEAVKVYYRVLGNVLAAEERRSRAPNLATLLGSRSFHRCLLACAFEVVVSAYKMITSPFPDMLARLGLKAFDMFKIINCFVQHEPTLPSDILRHLVSMEEQVVEALAWAPGSSLFPTLTMAKMQLEEAARNPPAAKPARKRTLNFDEDSSGAGTSSGSGSLSTPASSPSPAKLPDVLGTPPGLRPVITKKPEASAFTSAKPPMSPRFAPAATPPRHPTPRAAALPPTGTPSAATTPQSKSAFHVFASPMKKKIKLESGEAAPAAPQPSVPRFIGNAVMTALPSGRDTPVLQLVRDLFKKANMLAAHRLAALCETMDFSPHDHADLLSKVYSVVRHVLLEETHLLYGRHLDQILLSAVYGVCKVHRLDSITFKEVTTHYRQLSGPTAGPTGSARQDIFRSVVLRFSGDGTLKPLDTGDIIQFYNKIFVQHVKDLLIKMNPGESAGSPSTPGASMPGVSASRTPGTPTLRSLHQRIPSSPLRRCSTDINTHPASSSFTFRAPMPGAYAVPESPRKAQVVPDFKVFVSPMRDPTMTPRTKNLFCATPFSDGGCSTYMSPIPKGRIRVTNRQAEEMSPAEPSDHERAQAIINGMDAEMAQAPAI